MFTTIEVTNQYISSVHDLDELGGGGGGGLEFADYEGNSPNLAVGVLVVINFYHSIITGTTLRSKAGSGALSWVRIRWPHWRGGYY